MKKITSSLVLISNIDSKLLPNYFVIIIGKNEIKENKISLKEMSTGEQTLITLKEVIQKIKKG